MKGAVGVQMTFFGNVNDITCTFQFFYVYIFLDIFYLVDVLLVLVSYPNDVNLLGYFPTARSTLCFSFLATQLPFLACLTLY